MTSHKIKCFGLALCLLGAGTNRIAVADVPAAADKATAERQIATWDFEAPGSLAGWHIENPSNVMPPTWTLDADRPHGGAKSARLQINADAESSTKVFSTPLTLEAEGAADEARPDRVLTISLSVRSQNVPEGSAQIAMLEIDAQRKVIGWVGGQRLLATLPTSDEWKDARIEAKLSPRARTVIFYLRNENKTPGSIWIDDVSFKLKGVSTP
jgi:hypothetical protein